MRKRILAAFLSAVLTLSTFSVNVYAAEGGADILQGSEAEQEIAKEAAASKDYPIRTDEVITSMDIDGNVTEVESTNGTVGSDDSISTYSSDIQIVNFNTQGNAVTEYVEYGTNFEGYTNGAYGADGLYLGTTEDGKVKFLLSGVIGLVDQSLVEIVDFDAAESVSYYIANDGRLTHYISTDITTPGYATSLDNGPTPDCLSENVIYYSYDGHYFYTQDNLDAMVEDYNSDSRAHAANPNDPYYNYYQYLPMRSKTSYSADVLNTVINDKTGYTGTESEGETVSKLVGTGESFIKYQNTYGVNALLSLGIAANESAWGKSSIAQNKNNLFGLNAVDSSPSESADVYEDVDSCIKTFAETYMSKQYLNPSNWAHSGGYLGNKGSGINVRYASDPYWGEKNANVAWSIDKAYGNQDVHAYTLAVKDVIGTEHTGLNVRTEPSTSSNVIYTTKAYSNQSFIVMDETLNNGFYKVQSDGVLDESRSAIAETGEYDFDSMYVYVSGEYVKIVSTGTGGNIGTENPGGSTEPEEPEVVLPFTDVTEDSWYYDAVKYVYSKGIMTGVDETTFAPADTLLRAQFAVVVYRQAGEPDVAYSAKFPDVADGTWYTKAVLWANENGIVTGYEDGYFGPGDDLTREQLATMLYRYANYKGYDTSASADISEYPDAVSVGGYALNAVKWAVAEGIIEGVDDGTRLDPLGNSNRAECATMIMRFMERYN